MSSNILFLKDFERVSDTQKIIPQGLVSCKAKNYQSDKVLYSHEDETLRLVEEDL